MSYIAMNRFHIAPGREADFENVWRSRESHLKELKGFREFRLLKGPEGNGYRLYSSHVIWESEDAFIGWTKSEHFRNAHKNAGNASARDAIIGPPQFEGFETILHES